MTDRRHERVALALEVEFRTAGAFLVAYSTNLSKGGMFVETETPLAVGTEIALRFAIPGQPAIEVVGVVAWVNAWKTEEQGRGMGVRFEQLEARHGDAIDRIVDGFRGLRILIMCPEPSARGQLTRAVRMVIGMSEIIEADNAEAAEAGLARECDLAIIELDVGMDDAVSDDAGTSLHGGTPDGLLTLRLAKGPPRPIPVIALAQDQDRRALAAELGADHVLPSPAPFADLQQTVLRLLGKPSSIR